MRYYLKFAGLFFGSLMLVPLVIALVGAIDGSVGFMLLVVGILTMLVALGIGAIIFLIHGVRCAKQVSDPLHQAAMVLASPVLTVVVLLSMLPLFELGLYVGGLAKSAVERPHYRLAESAVERPRYEAGAPIEVVTLPPPVPR